ncbi:hypothetical protein ACIGEH_02720 [Bacillus altitudinis]|uniref:hypothetical protein n=1 Tax=Bacillus altitudinis TaxID=293387 RepID=UPI00148EC58E|nr:hypothetical protein [Bacillus altitudinis]MBY0185056.1 hypothetical protein [Bacillus aerophilus]NOL34473.1 hypothetical protein [Bacillus altitudinis]
MKVKRVNWISQEALEAEVVVTDGEFDISCFAQPFKQLGEDEFIETIFCLNVQNIVKVDQRDYHIEKSVGHFSYCLVGECIDKHDGKVQLGNLLFELDNRLIAGDIIDGDFISFCCERLDIY